MAHTAESLQQAFNYLFPNEVGALKTLARMLPEQPTVVNIGAGAGTSGLAFMESREDLFLITVDIQDEDSPLGCLSAERNALSEAGIPGHRYHQICGDSREVGQKAQSFDLLVFMDSQLVNIWRHYAATGEPMPFVSLVFIDADHSYEACKGDILAWLPNIRPGGIVALHDYRKHEVEEIGNVCPQPWPGVDQAVDELLAGKYEQVLRVDSLIAFRV